jgi:hypothetical protein
MDTFHISEEDKLSVTFNEQDGTLRVDAEEYIWFLSPSKGLELLEWLYERRDVMFRKAHDMEKRG